MVCECGHASDAHEGGEGICEGESVEGLICECIEFIDALEDEDLEGDDLDDDDIEDDEDDDEDLEDEEEDDGA
jgi:hypothetical protein